MSEKKEQYDAFAVPRNFGEDGVSFNGLSRRNLTEGCILAVASGYPIVFHLPVDLFLRIILLCFISLPLFFIGLVGYGGESLSQFLVTVVKFLFHRRCLRYYIDAGEPKSKPEKKKALARLRSFLKPDKDAIHYQKPQRKAKKPADAKSPQKESRRIHNMAQEFFPVEDIREGMIVTKDKRYIKKEKT